MPFSAFVFVVWMFYSLASVSSLVFSIRSGLWLGRGTQHELGAGLWMARMASGLSGFRCLRLEFKFCLCMRMASNLAGGPLGFDAGLGFMM